MNLVRCGLQSAGYNLCARMLDEPPGDWYLLDARTPILAIAVQLPDINQLPVQDKLVVLPDPLANFPYGFRVEPDHPV
jgi:hypothetical protein